jgi:N-dimethylarginine dimethylaminohydrolase
MIIPNSHSGFQPLKTCLVGQCYPPEFFEFIKDSRLRSVFERIAIETEEDYQKLISVLKKFNVDVIRPNISSDFGMYLYPDGTGKEIYKRPPMQPRDDMIVIGKNLYAIHNGFGNGYIDPWDDFINSVNPENLQDHREEFNTWKKIAPPCITRVGKDLYFDFFSYDIGYSKQQYFNLLQSKIIPENFKDYKIHYVDCGGHSDAVFSPVVPGLIITYTDPSVYKDSFPGWEVIQVPMHSHTSNDLALRSLKATNGKWWIKDQELDSELIDLVTSKFSSWTGYSIETQFDVNLFMVDQHNAIVNSYNPTVISTLEKYGVTAHIVPLRHRFFWDCGLHCATLDIVRAGECVDYF